MFVITILTMLYDSDTILFVFEETKLCHLICLILENRESGGGGLPRKQYSITKLKILR